MYKHTTFAPTLNFELYSIKNNIAPVLKFLKAHFLVALNIFFIFLFLYLWNQGKELNEKAISTSFIILAVISFYHIYNSSNYLRNAILWLITFLQLPFSLLNIIITNTHLSDGTIAVTILGFWFIGLFGLIHFILKHRNKPTLIGRKTLSIILIIIGYEFFNFTLCEYIFLDEDYEEFNTRLFEGLNYFGLSVTLIIGGVYSLLRRKNNQ